jgi:hypothetical protein
MLGSDKSRGYCLEIICADFPAGANLDSGHRTCSCTLSRGFSRSCPANSGGRLWSRSLRKRREADSGQEFSPTPRSQIVRKPTAAGVTPGRMEVPELRRDVESRGSPQGIAQPVRRRFGAEPDHSLRDVTYWCIGADCSLSIRGQQQYGL